jgi:hypothetical protein
MIDFGSRVAAVHALLDSRCHLPKGSVQMGAHVSAGTR